MIVLQLYSHVPLRAQLTYLVLFFLCLYCCPSVLYVTFFFALLASFSEQRVVSELCCILSAFFLLWWFNPIASLLPVSVYIAAECWHARHDRLARQALNTDYCRNPRSGGNDSSMVNNLYSCSFISASTTVNNSFASPTSGFAMLNNSCTVTRVTTRGCYNPSVDQPLNYVWVSPPLSSLNDQSSTSVSGDPTSFDSSFSNLLTLIKNGLFYIGTSWQVNTLVSGMEILSVSASSLVHAPLVRAQSNDDDGSGDRSSLATCRCGGTGRTSRGSCSCLGHVCSGCRCACLRRSESTRGPFFRGTDDDDDRSHYSSGRAYLGFGTRCWLLDAMTRLQDQFARLTLGGGNDKPASGVTLYSGKTNSDRHKIDIYDTKACSKVDFTSIAHSDRHISEELSALVQKCLSVTDTLVDGRENGDDAEFSHSSYAGDNGGQAYNSGNSMMFSGNGAIDSLSKNSVNNGGNVYGFSSVGDDIFSRDSVNGNDVDISRSNQELSNDVYTSGTFSHSSWISETSRTDTHVDDADINDNSPWGSGIDAESQSTNGSLRSWENNGSDHSSVNSPLYSPVINEYEENYNPFDSDDDRSSTGTAPLYGGTAVFNDESAFGTF